MKLRIAATLTAGLLLSGCSAMNFSDLFSFPGDEEVQAQAEAQPRAPAPVGAPAPNSFCRAVAQHEATADGFDQATELHMAQQSYAQCVVMFGGN